MEEKKKGGFIKGVLVGIVLTVAVAAAAGGIRVFTQAGDAPTDEKTKQNRIAFSPPGGLWVCGCGQYEIKNGCFCVCWGADCSKVCALFILNGYGGA